MEYILIFCLLIANSFCFQNDWELKQFSNINFNEYYESSKFNTTEEVIKDFKIRVENWMFNESLPGLVIGLSIRGKTIWTEGFGNIDIENNVTTDKESVWRLASVSKTLTSALVANLVDRRIIDINKTIHEYLSEEIYPRKTFDGKPVNITVRQLLSHMAGLHITDMKDFNGLYLASNVSQSIDRLKNEKLLSKPSTLFIYSNYGFQLIGAIIEAVLNKTYQNEIKKMFVSLGMNSTFAETRSQIFKHRPRYYHSKDKEDVLKNCDIIDDLAIYEGWWPSVGLVSTVDDMLKFGNAMLSSFKGKNKNFLNESTVKEFWRPETNGKTLNAYNYAKGWCVTNIDTSNSYPYKKLIWHAGGILGSSTIFYIFPDQDIVGVAFANRGYVKGLDELVLDLASRFQHFIH